MNRLAVADLAEKIAKLITSELMTADVTPSSNSIDSFNTRIERLENLALAPLPATPPLLATHPSTERFAIAEAIVDGLFDPYGKEKTCTFEPSKPCDHCSMCNSRGF